MIFAIQLGVTAAVAGVAWAAKKSLNSSNHWEKRVAFYDYMKCKASMVEDVLKVDNGDIVELNVLCKDASGSVNMAWARMMPRVHVTLVLKTNLNEYWSIEKNEKVIQVQKTCDKENITMMLDGNRRDKSLVYDRCQEDKYLNKLRSHSSLIGASINDVLEYLVTKEICIAFSYMENCQIFLDRLLTFIYSDKPFSLSLFDYTSNIYHNTELSILIRRNIMFSDVIWLYKEPIDSSVTITCVGFLIKAVNGKYWSFEGGSNRVFIQHSADAMSLMTMLNGILRDKPLQSYSCIESGMAHKTTMIMNLEVSNILKKYSYQVFVERALNIVYSLSNEVLSSPTLFDYSQRKVNIFLSEILRISDTAVLSEITLLNNVAFAGSNDMRDASADNCYVLLIQSSDSEYWSIERVKDNTCVQRANNKEYIMNQRDGLFRKKPLEYLYSSDKIISSKNIKLKGLLEFLMEFHRKYPRNECGDIIKCTLMYLGLIE